MLKTALQPLTGTAPAGLELRPTSLPPFFLGDVAEI